MLVLMNIVGCTFAWISIQSILFPSFTLLERIAFAIPLGFTTSSYACLLIATYYGKLTGKVVALSTFAHFVVGIYFAQGNYSLLFRSTSSSSLNDNHDSNNVIDKNINGDSNGSNRKIGKKPISVINGVNMTWLMANVFPLLATLPAILSIGYIMSTHYGPIDENGMIRTAGNCYADLPFHLTIINSFVYGVNSDKFNIMTMTEPIFSSARLVYPIVPDYYSATLIVSGISQYHALIIPSILVQASMFILLYTTAMRFSNGSHITGITTVYLTLYCGGNYEGTEPPYWLFFVKDILLPQRCAMFAYALTLGVISTVWISEDVDSSNMIGTNNHDNNVNNNNTKRKYHDDDDDDDDDDDYDAGNYNDDDDEREDSGENNGNSSSSFIYEENEEKRHKRWKYLQFAGIVTGLIPFVQGHSFIALIIIVPFSILLRYIQITVFQPMKNKLYFSFEIFNNIIADLFFFCTPAFVIALPQLATFTNAPPQMEFMSMWGNRKNGSFFSWVWECLGFFFILSIVSFYCLNTVQVRRYLSFWLLFIISLFVKFQSWNVDNMKLFYIWYFIAAMAVGMMFQSICKYRPVIGYPIAFIICAALCFPGFECVYKREFDHNFPFLGPPDVELAEWAKTHTEPDAIWLLATPPPRHIHPIPTLAGRAVFMGFKGWLQSRSLPYENREWLAYHILSGNDLAEDMMHDHKISHIVIQPNSHDLIEGAEISIEKLKNFARKTFHNNKYEVWSLKNPGKQEAKQMYGALYHSEIQDFHRLVSQQQKKQKSS